MTDPCSCAWEEEAAASRRDDRWRVGLVDPTRHSGSTIKLIALDFACCCGLDSVDTESGGIGRVSGCWSAVVHIRLVDCRSPGRFEGPFPLLWSLKHGRIWTRLISAQCFGELLD